jgi:hypothetical protein
VNPYLRFIQRVNDAFGELVEEARVISEEGERLAKMQTHAEPVLAPEAPKVTVETLETIKEVADAPAVSEPVTDSSSPVISPEEKKEILDTPVDEVVEEMVKAVSFGASPELLKTPMPTSTPESEIPQL